MWLMPQRSRRISTGCESPGIWMDVAGACAPSCNVVESTANTSNVARFMKTSCPPSRAYYFARFGGLRTPPAFGRRVLAIYCYWMKFAPEYVTNVLNENFEDAKELLLSPLMAINYAHLVMLAERGIISSADAKALRNALDGISLDSVREVLYDGTYEDLFFYIERLIKQACNEEVAGRLHTARSRNDIDMTMYRMRHREFIAGLAAATLDLRDALLALAERHTATV